ncbi:MAG: Thiamine-monophosphate kinase [Candidatus Methanophagaceae archaeon]|nr:MAG: Thiamine-monophosphate kinase [Methanophagales archaeon]
MKIEQLGEIGLIERITKKFRVSTESIAVGAGEDDCAVIELARADYKYLVATTDMLQESTHLPVGISPFQIGWSAVAVNLSDIAAMGARPYAFTIALGIPAHTETAFVDAMVEGIADCASAYDTAVVGGDIAKSKELILTGTCFGFADKPVRRAGAKVGDLVCVTGSVGNAALGLKILKEWLTVPKKVEETAKKALFQPVPRIPEGITLADSGLVTSMLDISDGLALSLAELARSSKVGFEIYEAKVPVLSEEMRAAVRDVDLRELAFFYGGDYELLFTMDADVLADEFATLQKKVGISVIGVVVPSEESICFKTGQGKEQLKIKGYQHF